MEIIREYLPLLVPLIVIQLVLMTFALLDMRRREKTRGPRWVWVLVVIFVSTIGPILYFTLGRSDE